MITTYRPKEISWLSFNERVLQQAENKTVPLYERIKFLAIYSSNMDEFFRVRVATLKRLTKLKEKATEVLGHNPIETLEDINKIVIKQNILYEKLQKEIKEELKNNNIHLINETQLTEKQKVHLLSFFRNQLKSSLMPLIISEKKIFPDLIDDTIYFTVNITPKNEEKPFFSILQLPTHKFDRFIVLPKEDENTYIIYLDDVVRLGLSELYYFIEHDNIEAHAFKITRDAELDIKDDISSTYIELIDQSIKQRKKGNPVRFIYDQSMKEFVLEKLLKLLKINKADAVVSSVRYHNKKDFIKFPNVLGKEFTYKNLPTIEIPVLTKQKSFFDTLNNQDILLHYPYHSFNYFIDFLKEASVDPKVESIKISLYRLSKNSDIVAVLLNAVKNGKIVIAVIELKARFDEDSNIKYSKILTESGVKVIYGVNGLKVHSKITLIKRNETEKTTYYAAVGTGNYNEATAKLYTDFTLLTSNKLITHEVLKVFSFLKNNYKHYKYENLLVSPFNFRNSLKKLINNEIENAKKGLPSYIHLKVNNLDDREIINMLIDASNNGVDVVLLVRGMFSLITEIKGVSNKIIALGIIDKYLEHSRILIFGNNNNPAIYLASADIMVRNIDRRIEVTVPIFDEKLKQQLIDIFKIHLSDNTASRILDKNLTNKMVLSNKKTVNAQDEVHNYITQYYKKTINNNI